MNPVRRRSPRSSWCCLLDSPLLLAASGAMICGCAAMLEVGGALQRAEAVRLAAAPQLARLAAETALAEVLSADPGVTSACVPIGDVAVTMRRGGGQFELVSEVAQAGAFHFRAEVVPGAAPAVFAHACSAVDPTSARVVAGSRLITTDDLPRLDPVQLAAAAPGERFSAFRLDQGVALLAWESGTEKPDYVFDPTRAGDLDTAGGLILVRGNLWVETGEQPARFRLQRDLVVVVDGNFYVGRSLVVEGPGRLVVVARRSAGEASFADLDRNGRWSRGDLLRSPGEFVGPFEGAGSVFLGLPGALRSLRCEVGLVVGGELHAAAAVQVSGPLVLANGVTAAPAVGVALVASRDWVFDVGRERVPGFVTAGLPRPGALVCTGMPGRNDEQQGLYLSAPAR